MNIFSSSPNSRKWKEIPSIGLLALVFSLYSLHFYTVSHIETFLGTNMYGSPDRKRFPCYLNVFLAVPQCFSFLPFSREKREKGRCGRQREKTVLTYLICLKIRRGEKTVLTYLISLYRFLPACLNSSALLTLDSRKDCHGEAPR